MRSKISSVLCALVVVSLCSGAATALMRAGQRQREAVVPEVESDHQKAIRHSMWFESHGRDDGREWASAIIKGAQFIKVDFNFRKDAEDCLVQERLPFRADNYTNGCFILTHYYTRSQPHFNTTQDLTAFVADPQNAYLFNGQFGKIKFQMCFKNKQGLSNTTHQTPGTDAWKWKTLMDAFFNQTQAVLEGNPMLKENVQFVFNTIPEGELLPLISWWPWNTSLNTNLQGMNQTSTGSRSYNSPGYRQIQVLNMDWDSSAWNTAAKNFTPAFGKFNTAARAEQRYPFIAWEPSEQKQLYSYYSQMLGFNFLNPAGLLIAFNPDPSLYHTYSSNLTHRFSHQVPSPEYNNFTTTMTTVMKGERGGDEYIVTATQNLTKTYDAATGRLKGLENHVTFHVHVRSEHSRLKQVMKTSVLQADHAPFSRWGGNVSQVNPPYVGMQANLFYDQQKSTWFYSFMLFNRHGELPDGTQGTWKPKGVMPAPPKKVQGEKKKQIRGGVVDKIKTRSVSATAGGMVAGQTEILGVDHDCTPKSTDCRRVFLRAFTFPNEQGNFTIQVEGQLLADGFLPFGPAQVVTNHANGAIAASSAEPILDVAIAGTLINVTALSETFYAHVAVTVSWSSKRKVYASFMDLKLSLNWGELRTPQSHLPDTAGIDSSSVYPHPDDEDPPLLGTGVYPSASMLPATAVSGGFEDAKLLLVYGESFCQNNQVVDDDFGPLKGTKECEVNNATFYEFAEQPVQSYTFGALGDYMHYAKQHQAQRPYQAKYGYANTCNTGMFHGIWDVGYRSSAVLLEKDPALDWNVQDGGYLAVAALKGMTEDLVCLCGAPETNGGALVLDAFPLFGIYNESTVLNPV